MEILRLFLFIILLILNNIIPYNLIIINTKCTFLNIFWSFHTTYPYMLMVNSNFFRWQKLVFYASVQNNKKKSQNIGFICQTLLLVVDLKMFIRILQEYLWNILDIVNYRIWSSYILLTYPYFNSRELLLIWILHYNKYLCGYHVANKLIPFSSYKFLQGNFLSHENGRFSNNLVKLLKIKRSEIFTIVSEKTDLRFCTFTFNNHGTVIWENQLILELHNHDLNVIVEAEQNDATLVPSLHIGVVVLKCQMPICMQKVRTRERN